MKQRRVKCPYCGRDAVEVTHKGLMRPHVQPSGRRCMHVSIPFDTSRATGAHEWVKRQIKRRERRA